MDYSALDRRLSLLFAFLVLGTASPQPVHAFGVVGTGTADSCTEAALDTALVGGGDVAFNCGPIPVSITVTSQKIIGLNTRINGGNLITLDGKSKTSVIGVNSGATLALANMTIANGHSASPEDGGAIYNAGTLTVTQSAFFDNSADSGHGGAIWNADTLTVTNSTFSGNSALYGAGIYNDFGTLTVINSTFSGNNAYYEGGAISRSHGALTVINSTFSGNSAGNLGGAIETVGSVGTVAVTNSTFSGNQAGDGGAIDSESADTLTVTNSTFSGNSVSRGTGGAIRSYRAALTVTASTFSGNSATPGPGGAIDVPPVCGPFGLAPCPATLTNTIVANSTESGDCVGTITDGGHNLDDDGSCGFSAANGSFSNTNPMLAPAGLADNGGPTPTIALQVGSPAINAGDQAICAAAPLNNLDQRGYVRPGTGATNCSIGAYEFNSPGRPCVGDCNSDRHVTVDEILTMGNVALGNASLTMCNTGDANHDSQVTVDEILTAVHNALNGCDG